MNIKIFANYARVVAIMTSEIMCWCQVTSFLYNFIKMLICGK